MYVSGQPVVVGGLGGVLVLQPGDGAVLVHGESRRVVRYALDWGRGRRRWRRGRRGHLLRLRMLLWGGVSVAVVAVDDLQLLLSLWGLRWFLRGQQRGLQRRQRLGRQVMLLLLRLSRWLRMHRCMLGLRVRLRGWCQGLVVD